MIVPDSVVAVYVENVARLRGDDAEVKGPDSGEMVGRAGGGDVWRLADGWGEVYVLDPPRGDAVYVCSKMPDVMVADVAEKFRSTIDGKSLGMGDKTWDAAVLAALGETT